MRNKTILISTLLTIMICSFSLSACASSPTPTDQSLSSDIIQEDGSESTTSAESNESTSVYDPYAIENHYDISEELFEKRDDVDYGTIEKDVTYYSTTAEDDKQCNILLPAGYDETQAYPVMYVFHGFGGDHSDQIDDDSYLVLLYGNMLHDNLTVPMIIVNVDMYTDKLADKEDKTEEELRYIYDKAIDDIALDLMPFIEQNYAVKTGRENTAVAGMSEGGAKALCTGFQWLDRFGYIGAFAPDTGVIPTEYYKGTFWNTPVFDTFPQPTAETTPFYLYLAVGDEDPWNTDCTLYYHEVLDDMGIRNQTDLVEGFEHDYLFWQQCFYNYLSKCFRSE